MSDDEVSDLSDSEKKQEEEQEQEQEVEEKKEDENDNKIPISKTTPNPQLSSHSSVPPSLQHQPSTQTIEQDEDPRNRIYTDPLVIPKGLTIVLGMLMREIMLNAPKLGDDQHRIDFIRDFFEQLRDAREADPTMELDRFLNTQSKIMQARIRDPIPSPNSLIEPPIETREMLHTFTMELIRYTPDNMFEFAHEYFKALKDKTLMDAFLNQWIDQKRDAYKLKWPDADA